MNHIEELRKLIGHRPILMVGAGILIQDADQRLLMLKRSDNHLWGLPGGAVEPGENLEATARRETLEETGLEVQSMDLFGVFSGPELFYEYPNGDQVYNVTIMYQAMKVSGDIHLNHEHTAWQFFKDEEIPFHKGSPLNPILVEYVTRHKTVLNAKNP